MSHDQIKLLVNADLPNVNPAFLAKVNQFIRSVPFEISVNDKNFVWQWCAPGCDRYRDHLILQGESTQYQLYLSKNNFSVDSNCLISCPDYPNDLACMIWSAAHNDLIEIITQVVDDSLSVSQLNTLCANQSDELDINANDRCRLGFKLFTGTNKVLVEGELLVSSQRLEQLKVDLTEDNLNESTVFDELRWSLPIVIDRCTLSYRETQLLAIRDVIRIRNKSLLQPNTCVSIEIGVMQLEAIVNQRQGKIISIKPTKTTEVKS